MAKKKWESSSPNREGDPQYMTDAIKRFEDACLPVGRPSDYQLKIGGLNFWPSTGTVQIDGQAKQEATGIDEVFRILEKSDPAMKYLKKPKLHPTNEYSESLKTIRLDNLE